MKFYALKNGGTNLIMNYNEIKDLLETISKTDITHLNLEIGNVKIELNRGSKINNSNPTENVIEPKQIEYPVISNKDDVDTNEFKGTRALSPIVGTFYKASSPTSEPFVKVGQKVSKGDILYIIEAMKVINEITADTDGEILEILVEDNQFVEFNQHIMTIG